MVTGMNHARRWDTLSDQSSVDTSRTATLVPTNRESRKTPFPESEEHLRLRTQHVTILVIIIPLSLRLYTSEIPWLTFFVFFEKSILDIVSYINVRIS